MARRLRLPAEFPLGKKVGGAIFLPYKSRGHKGGKVDRYKLVA